MQRVRFLMIGGFLGAGKTTTIARLARHWLAGGRRVGLVTNDQAYDLVDTQLLRSQGFPVGEVPGACFCCKFDDLVDTVSALQQSEHPDVIIAEPVGSCTDLVATVIEPLVQLYGDRFDVGPLVVLLKPEHGRKILQAQQGAGFSPQAAYIFLKQIEEADVVAINKIDKLTAAERDELVQLVRRRFPEKTVLAISARCGDGFGQLVEAAGRLGKQHRTPLELDYDIYAAGEAELGWLNCHVAMQCETGRLLDLDQLVVWLVAAIRDRLDGLGAETAHLKVLASGDHSTAVANLVHSRGEAELSWSTEARVPEAELIVNARVAIDPVQLESIVQEAVHQLAGRIDGRASITRMQRFRPARPEPTHRFAGEAPRA